MLQKGFQPKRGRRGANWFTVSCLALMVFGLGGVRSAPAQTFSSGSTGADGALTLTTPGTVIFNPKTFNPPLNPAGDNVFNFTTITIASGVTLKLTSKVLSSGVIFLASGDVTIAGTIDLSGDDGPSATNQTSARIPAAGGAGGYSGGVGGSIVSGQPSAQPGNGPGGGAVSPTPETTPGQGGTFTGDQFLTPLIGGSGGGGANRNAGAGNFGGGGGGGGGAIWIASSTQIYFNGGAINALGGNSSGGATAGGSGSGGAVRLIANTLRTNSNYGSINVNPGSVNGQGQGSGLGTVGIVRCEFFTGACPPSSVVPYISTPFKLVLPTTVPSALTVTSINGIPINSNPFSFPDATINSTSAVTVAIQGQYIPVGTVPKVYVFSEAGPDQIVTASALSGTLASSTATAQITFPTGGSRGYVKAVW